jgi:excisionase family DNA binding protein
MTLQQASKYLAISKKRLWRAVKAGQLEAARVQKGGRWEYRVSEEQLTSYRRKYLDSLEMRAVSWSEYSSAAAPGGDPPVPDRSKVMERSTGQTETTVPSRSEPNLHGILMERLTRAERRVADLELELERGADEQSKAREALQTMERREKQLAKVTEMLQFALETMQGRC